MNDVIEVSGPTRAPALVLLRSGSVPALAAVLLTVLTCWALGGGWAAISAAIGGALSLLAFVVGPLVMHSSRSATAPGVMARAVLAYSGVVFMLGVAFAALGGVEDLVGEYVAAGVLVTAAAWLAGQFRAIQRLRLPVFEEAQQEQRTQDDVPSG